MNHATNPNLHEIINDDGKVVDVALRDIAAGEELTIDYHIFDLDAARKLGHV
jgi:SET domain-containing protein